MAKQDKFNIIVFKSTIELLIKCIWPVLLIITWLILLYFSVLNNVFNDIPVEIRENIGEETVLYEVDKNKLKEYKMRKPSIRAIDLYQEGISLYQGKKYTESAKILKKALRSDPKFILAEELLDKCNEKIKDSPGFIQDPFYTIWQFFWLPFIWLSFSSFKLLPKSISKLWIQDCVYHPTKKGKKECRDLLNECIGDFNKRIDKTHYWILGIIIGLGSMADQVWTQISRMEIMDIMYWWDWRISKSIYIIRLLMVGLDMMLATILIIRSIHVISFIRKILHDFKFNPQPLHPDKVGGLSPIGKLCLSFIYPLLVIGIMLATSVLFHKEMTYWIKNIFFILFYMVAVVFVFFYPMLKVHAFMKEKKENWLSSLSREINKILTKIDNALSTGDDSVFQKQTEKLDGLRKYYEILEETPLWPFNTQIITKFLSSLFLPAIIFVIEVIVRESIL